MTDTDNTYKMTIDLNVLNHLGVGLYSNIPAVLSEVVANSWDADAEHVSIDVDTDGQTITIEDDGHGMTIAEVNERYLKVGYKRRKVNDGLTSRFKRPVMGRKGIGKLSLFSIANTVSVYTVKDGQRHGFVMDVDKIKDSIDAGMSAYNPDPIREEFSLQKGTRIVLTNIKRNVRQPTALQRRLARRFSIIGAHEKFEVTLNRIPISVQDRDYFQKLQYIWTFGKHGETIAEQLNNVKSSKRPSEAQFEGYAEEIDGWIGTTHKAGQTNDEHSNESINKIVIMVRGKLAQEDILSEFGEGGFYSKYIIGEIHADFLDQNTQEDSSTTNRQGIIEDDPRYQLLKNKIRDEIKNMQRCWSEWRNEDGIKTAFTFPNIKEWFNDLTEDHQKAAKKLLGRINQITIDNEDDKRHMFISAILTFESLKYRNLLTRLDEISLENLNTVKEVFIQLDDLESNAYYQIIKDRLAIIDKLNNLVDVNAKERIIQKYLYNHLWLLDPSWERATDVARMEQTVNKAFDDVYSTLSEEEKLARLDIRYITTSGKNVIIELKRPERQLSTTDIFNQIYKYYNAVEKVMKSHGRCPQLEFVCIVGNLPMDWNSDGAARRARESLHVFGARILTYDQLIDNAQKAYLDYTIRQKKVSRVFNIITGVTQEDAAALSPTNQ